MTRLLFACMFLVAGSQVHAEDWPQWLGTQRDGVWRETGLLDKFPEGGPKKVWSVKVGGGYSGPAVVNGKVFVTDRLLGTGEKNPESGFAKPDVKGGERVLCLDAKTGKELWKHSYDCLYKVQYNSGPRATPTVDGDYVYTLGTMGDLLCLKVADGTVVWSKNFVRDYQARVPIWGFSSHPLIDDKQLICITGGAKDYLVVSYDKVTGKELWHSQELGDDCGYAPPMIYTFAGVRTLVIWHSRAVVGLDPATGKRLWIHPFDIKAALTAPTPRQLDGDRLFVTAFYDSARMLKIGSSSAELIWKGKHKSEKSEGTDTLHSIMTTPFIKDGYIYGVCSYGELRCIKAANGERVWSTSKPTVGTKDAEGKPTRWGHAFLIEQGDRFWIFNEQGELIIAKLTPKGYEEIDRAKILKPDNRSAGRPVVWMHPGFAGKQMFARNDSEIVCIDLAK